TLVSKSIASQHSCLDCCEGFRLTANPRLSMSITGTVFARTCRRSLALSLSAVLISAHPLKALILTTNCQDVAASLPQPKRIQSQCPTTAAVGFWSVLPQFSSGGMYHFFGNNPGGTPTAYGLVQSDVNGVFNWKVACSNGAI